MNKNTAVIFMDFIFRCLLKQSEVTLSTVVWIKSDVTADAFARPLSVGVR